jgi:hypothetical protein
MQRKAFIKERPRWRWLRKRSVGLKHHWSIHVTIMDNVCCMLIDANWIPKIWPYVANDAVLIYNNLPHSVLDNQKSPNDVYEDSSDFSKLYVFGCIWHALKISKLLHLLGERSEKGLFLGIDSGGSNKRLPL